MVKAGRFPLAVEERNEYWILVSEEQIKIRIKYFRKYMKTFKIKNVTKT